MNDGGWVQQLGCHACDPVTVYIFAATLPIPCVVSVLPVPGRAGKLRSLTDGAGSLQRARSSGK